MYVGIFLFYYSIFCNNKLKNLFLYIIIILLLYNMYFLYIILK